VNNETGPAQIISLLVFFI